MDDTELGLTFPMTYDFVGGALTDAYQVLELSKVDPKSLNAQVMPIVLVSKAPKAGGEALTDLSGFTAKTGLAITDIVALNGVAVLKQMASVAPVNEIQKYVYLPGKPYTEISKLLPIQVNFISFFHNMYFLARLAKSPETPNFTESFTKKFLSIQQKIKQNQASQLEIFGIPTTNLNPFIQILANEVLPKDREVNLLRDDNLKLLQKTPSEILKDFKKLFEPIDATDVRSSNTNEDMLEHSLNSRDQEPIAVDAPELPNQGAQEQEALREDEAEDEQRDKALKQIKQYVNQEKTKARTLKSAAFKADKDAAVTGKQWIEAIQATQDMVRSANIQNPVEKEATINKSLNNANTLGETAINNYQSALNAWKISSAQEKIYNAIEKTNTDGVSLNILKQVAEAARLDKPDPRATNPENPSPRRNALLAGKAAAKKVKDEGGSLVDSVAAAIAAATQSANNSKKMNSAPITRVAVEAGLDAQKQYAIKGGANGPPLISALEHLMQQHQTLTQNLNALELADKEQYNAYKQQVVIVENADKIYQDIVKEQADELKKLEMSKQYDQLANTVDIQNKLKKITPEIIDAENIQKEENNKLILIENIREEVSNNIIKITNKLEGLDALIVEVGQRQSSRAERATRRNEARGQKHTPRHTNNTIKRASALAKTPGTLRFGITKKRVRSNGRVRYTAFNAREGRGPVAIDPQGLVSFVPFAKNAQDRIQPTGSKITKNGKIIRHNYQDNPTLLMSNANMQEYIVHQTTDLSKNGYKEKKIGKEATNEGLKRAASHKENLLKTIGANEHNPSIWAQGTSNIRYTHNNTRNIQGSSRIIEFLNKEIKTKPSLNPQLKDKYEQIIKVLKNVEEKHEPYEELLEIKQTEKMLKIKLELYKNMNEKAKSLGQQPPKTQASLDQIQREINDIQQYLQKDKPKIDKIEKDYTDAFNQKEAFIQQIDIKNILDQFALTSHKIANSQYRQNMPKFEINDILECEVKNVPNSKVRLTMKKHKRTPLGAKIVSGVTPSGEIKHYAEEYCKKITSLQ
jgi:hypothetical protein